MQAIVIKEMKYRGVTAKVGTILALSDFEFNDLKQYNKVEIYVAPVVEVLHVEQPAAVTAADIEALIDPIKGLSDKLAPKANTRTPRGK